MIGQLAFRACSITRRLALATVLAAVGAGALATDSYGQLPGGGQGTPGEAVAVYRLELPDGGVETFAELSGITSEIDQSEYMQAGQKGAEFGRFLGRALPITVTLKRRMSTAGLEMWKWHEAARAGTPTAFRSVSLSVVVEDEPVFRFNLVNAFPRKLEVAAVRTGTGTSQTITETWTLQADDIFRVA